MGFKDSAREILHNNESLTTLAEGESGTVVEIHGGGHLEKRLANMGLRPGKTVTKLGALPGRGPITVEIDGTQIALGRGIAHRVVIERPHQTPKEKS